MGQTVADRGRCEASSAPNQFWIRFVSVLPNGRVVIRNPNPHRIQVWRDPAPMVDESAVKASITRSALRPTLQSACPEDSSAACRAPLPLDVGPTFLEGHLGRVPHTRDK